MTVKILSLITVLLFSGFFSVLDGGEVENSAAKQEKPPIYEGMAISPEMSKEIIERITAKYSKMYEKYSGIKSTRHVTAEWRHPKTNELLEKEEVVYTRYDDFYENLVFEVQKYSVDGVEKNPKSYDPRESKPGIPHFDKNGEKEYIRTVVGVEKVHGKLCYKIKMVPRTPKDEHFAGHVWITVDGLEYMQNEGTSGKMRFGVSDLYVKYKAKDFGDYFFFTSGYTKVTLNVLGLYRRTLIFNFVNKDIEPIPRKK
jgi:hypothetical protein